MIVLVTVICGKIYENNVLLFYIFTDIHLSPFKPTTEENFYDTSLFGEVALAHNVVHDHTLRGLSCKLKENIAVSYSLVTVALLVVNAEQLGIIILARFTDSDKKVFVPFNTNWKDIIYIDEIRESEDGVITLRQGNDVMVMNSQHNETCRRSDIPKDFDKLSGKSILMSNYPFPFDWGCDVLGDEVYFCEILKQNESYLKEAGSNVCIEKTTTYHSKQCPAYLAIRDMTGFFRKELPFFSAGDESFEAEWIDIVDGAGIVFPCFTV